jgi:hypothetical protein
MDHAGHCVFRAEPGKPTRIVESRGIPPRGSL